MNVDSRDMQMDYIRHLMYQAKDRIKAAKSPHVEATRCMYEHIRDYIQEIVDTS